MVNENLTDRQERLAKFFKAVEEAQKFQDDLLKYGLEAVHLYVEDIEGDWLEKWSEDEQELEQVDLTSGLLSNSVVDLTTFLKSDDAVAVRVRQQLGNKLIPNVAMKLEECLQIVDQDEQLLAIKNVLADEDPGVALDESLASDLLEKLVIVAKQS